MIEKPILFSGAMVRAILDGRKIQTRRIIKNQNLSGAPRSFKAYDLAEGGYGFENDDDIWKSPYGKPGDQLWVRETWRVGAWKKEGLVAVDYAADNFPREEWLKVTDSEQFERLSQQSTDDAIKANTPIINDRFHWEFGKAPTRWRPSIHMPRWAARIFLRVTDIRVERLQEITGADVFAEGVDNGKSNHTMGSRYENMQRMAFEDLWDSINGNREGCSWEDNPWVWVVEFERVTK